MTDDAATLAEDNAFVDGVALLRKFRLDQKVDEELRQFRARRSAYKRKTVRKWGAAFIAYARVATYATHFGNDLGVELHAHLEAEKPHLVNVMARLQASACLVAFEVLALLEVGLAQAALARWRTLHEIAVTALFVQAHGEDVALRFWTHGIVERKRLANEHDHAGLDNLEPTILEEIDEDRDNVLARWGSDFAAPYGWAADTLG